jgi:hypothetical protein
MLIEEETQGVQYHTGSITSKLVRSGLGFQEISPFRFMSRNADHLGIPLVFFGQEEGRTVSLFSFNKGNSFMWDINFFLLS